MSMYKLRVAYTYSEWKSGQGWELEDSYMGIDDVYTNDYAVLGYDKDDLISVMKDYVSDEINAYQADDSHDTCYTYSVYKTYTNEKLLSVSVWLSELASK